jgi:capsular exopolysaccharide synthesis family protein
MAPDSTGQQDLRAYLRIFWRWKYLFLAFLVVIPAAAYLIERDKPKTYQASTLLELQTVQLGGASGAPITTGNIAAVARLVSTLPVAKKAAPLLTPPGDPSELLGSVSASADPNTGFLTITSKAPSATRAAAIANAFAQALSHHQTGETNKTLREQIRAYRRQLKDTPIADQGGRATLIAEIAQLDSLVGASGSGAQVIQAATPPNSPIGPGTRRAVEIALLIALLLGAGAVLVAESGDRRLRTPEDLERIAEWPLLAVVPRTAFSFGKDNGRGDDESFQMLRASLTYFNVDEKIESVAVISPLAQDGKTTVAVGLARAMARAGKSAILVDADLRRPQAGLRLGIEAEQGLGAVLAGEAELDDVLIEYGSDEENGDGKLLVLPSGPPPPNPVALISSRRMESVMRELEARSDLVIIDTAAALAISDSLPLLRGASGVIMIVRMNRSASAAVRRMKTVVTSAHANVLGVVATGAESTSGYGSYGDYYHHNGNGHHATGLGRLRRLTRARD